MRFNAGRERCSQMGCFFPASGRPGNLERTGIRVSGKAEQTLAGADGNRSRAGEHEGKENISHRRAASVSVWRAAFLFPDVLSKELPENTTASAVEKASSLW